MLELRVFVWLQCVVERGSPGGGVECDEVERHPPVGEPHSCTKTCKAEGMAVAHSYQLLVCCMSSLPSRPGYKREI